MKQPKTKLTAHSLIKNCLVAAVLGISVTGTTILLTGKAGLLSSAHAQNPEKLEKAVMNALAKVDYACYPVRDIRNRVGYQSENRMGTFSLHHINPLLSGEGEGSRKVAETGVVVGPLELFCTPVFKSAEM